MDRVFVRYLLVGSLVALPAMLVLMAVYFRPGGDLLEQRGYYLGLDFVNYWMGGRLALEGRVGILYDIAAYNELLQRWFAPAKEFMIFSYPPNALALLAPIGFFPYWIAFPLWLVLGTAAFFAACLWRRPTHADRWLVVALAISPVLWVNLNFGQLGLILAFLFVGALRLLPTKPVIAGVMIGLLTIKPQLGLLLPLVLVMAGAWRAFATASVTALALVALSLALYGAAPWEAWWSETAQVQLAFVSEMKSFFVTQMTTPFIALRFLGASVATALAVQGLVAALVVAATWGVLKGSAPWPLKATVVAFGSVLISPYVLAYDLAIPLAALVWCLSSGSLRPSGFAAAAVVFVWAIPFAIAIILQARGIAIAPLAVLLCYVWLLREALVMSSLAPARVAPSSHA
jgi:alpha-1,2-mannosyltransferase